MTLEATEKECAAVATGPRITLAMIEAEIDRRIDVTGRDAVYLRAVTPINDPRDAWSENVKASLGVLSICLLVMKNGFTIIGKSAPAVRENFNAELGKKLAYEDAIRQIWPMMGWQLRSQLYAEAGGGAGELS